MAWIEANGASLRYELSGEGSQTLVLVHKLGGMLESWDETMPALREKYRVLRYDQRGFGLSEKAQGTLSLDVMAGESPACSMRSICETSLDRPYPEILRGNKTRFEAYRLRWLANASDGFAAINRMLARMNMDADFAKVTCPTLVLSAKHDTLRTPASVKLIADALPNVRYIETESGHFMAVQTPEMFLEYVLPFLGEN